MAKSIRNLFLACGLLFQAAAILADGARIGSFSVSATLPELVGTESAARFEDVVEADESIEWEIYVPESYDPDKPAGLIVFISPTDSGRMPARWKDVMETSNVIWIGANDSGNRIQAARRATYAMVAPAVVAREYRVDAARVYISGFSGGGRVASMVAPEYPQVFKGAVFICGVNSWDNRTRAQLDAVQANRYVFLTGTKDFNRRETRSVHRSYRRAGVKNVLLMDISGMDHSLPSAPKFAEAIAYLDDY
jgi:predicted peptidase